MAQAQVQLIDELADDAAQEAAHAAHTAPFHAHYAGSDDVEAEYAALDAVGMPAAAASPVTPGAAGSGGDGPVLPVAPAVPLQFDGVPFDFGEAINGRQLMALLLQGDTPAWDMRAQLYEAEVAADMFGDELFTW